MCTCQQCTLSLLYVSGEGRGQLTDEALAQATDQGAAIPASNVQQQVLLVWSRMAAMLPDGRLGAWDPCSPGNTGETRVPSMEVTIPFHKHLEADFQLCIETLLAVHLGHNRPLAPGHKLLVGVDLRDDSIQLLRREPDNSQVSALPQACTDTKAAVLCACPSAAACIWRYA